MTLPGNTILINTRAVHRDFCQLEIYHECIHYDWHFMFYRLQHMHNNDVSALRTRRAVVTDSRGSRNPLRWLEWQANRGSFGLDDAAVHDARPGAGRGSQPGRL